METLKINQEEKLVYSSSIKLGLVVCLMLILYFIVMKAFGMHEIIELRAINFIFLASVILLSIKNFAKNNGKLPYFRGIRIGALITLFAVVPFAIFMLAYLIFDPVFMESIKMNSSVGHYLTPGLAAGAIGIEGLASGLIFTYIVMPYFKED